MDTNTKTFINADHPKRHRSNGVRRIGVDKSLTSLPLDEEMTQRVFDDLGADIDSDEDHDRLKQIESGQRLSRFAR